ncbi:hypothetical protein MMC21_002945 [Puttea exsequens]|nr:hypothetical protein [Puttea exsequens]
MADEATRRMVMNYRELNGPVDVLDEEPSPLGFMRYVARNRPFIVRGGCSQWEASRKWNTAYLRETMMESRVLVAITPQGNADASVENPQDGQRYFAKPFECQQPFRQFIDRVQAQGLRYQGSPVMYSQAQNDNLRQEYAQVYPDVMPNIVWASTALQRSPDAINLWIGNHHSVTALHRDNYENIYCQILGCKNFILLPPVETACVNEKLLPQATYSEYMELVPDNPPSEVPCAIWDPDQPEHHSTQFSHLSRPIHVRINAGDMLYLPACW